ncbi:hypothetical protein B9Y61_15690 [Stenotrophomonas maltophilia]|nr:hypothetical protein B9Y61_15690 [Stenotrophomonas maltophilia]
MDAAAKPPGMGLRRLPQPDPPRHPTDSPLLLLLLLLLRLRPFPLRVQGAALQTPPLSIPRSGLSAAHTPATARYAATESSVAHREPS